MKFLTLPGMENKDQGNQNKLIEHVEIFQQKANTAADMINNLFK